MRIVKPKTKKAKRALEARAPKEHENAKRALLLHGTKSSARLKSLLSDVHHLKKADGSVKLTQKNDKVRPFEGGGEASLEFLSQKTDCSLFMFGSHSKKRPHNLVLGRMYDHHLFDMVELGVDGFRSIREMGGGGKYAPQVGSKPCFVFVGAEFDDRPELAQLKGLLLDFFRGQVVDSINLAGLDRVFVCVAAAGKVHIRHCAIRLKKSGTRVPRIELIDAGPSLDAVVRRHRLPGEDLQREAMRTPKSLTKKKVKNVSTDSLAGKVGRIYMPRQEVGGMALSKMKGLKRERRQAAAGRAEGKPGPFAKVKKTVGGVSPGAAARKQRRKLEQERVTQ